MSNNTHIKTISVQAGQSLADIALQEYSTVEGMVLLLQANPGLSVTSDLFSGQELNVFTKDTLNLVKEVVKVEPYASQLQNILSHWVTLVSSFIGYKIWVGTKDQRDAIPVKDPKTIYLVEE